VRWEPQERIGLPRGGEKRFFRPFLAVEGLWVSPPGGEIEIPSGQECLELELGRARGSGIHPATRCALRLIEHALTQGVPERALDVDTGTGVLALAMALWRVGSVMAVDRDPHAVKMARRNVRRNGLQGRMKVRCRDVNLEGRLYPLVVAHISHKAIARSAKPLLRCLGEGGWLVLGGIWHRWVDSTLERFTPPLQVIRRDREAWWEAVLLRRE
jgi:ribosomal protein L11 methyltransferase